MQEEVFYMNKKIGIFAPARLNSQRLPNKQILPIGDSCMFEICCKKLANINLLYNIPVYVLIYDKPLINIAKKYSNITIIYRDQDTVEQEGPLNYIYKDILTVPEDYLVFLNPCLIFLSETTIINKIKEFDQSNKNYGTSVKKIQNWIWDNEHNIITDINYKRLATKEIVPWYQCAHCFHIFNKHNFIQDGLMLKEDLCLLEIPVEETEASESEVTE